MLVIAAVAAPLCLLRSVFRAAYIASIPALVGRPQIARANGILESIYSTTVIVGPLLGGFLSAAIGPGLTLGLDAASFAVSAIGLVLISADLRAPLGRVRARILDDIKEGVTHVARHPVLRGAILYFSLFSALIAPVIVGLVVRVRVDLHQSMSAYGVVIAGFGVGAVVGSLIGARLGRRTNVPLVLFAGVAAEGLATVALALADSVGVMAGLSVIIGAGESLVVVTYVTLRTAHSPDELLGRIASTARVVSLGLQPIGLLIGAALTDVIGATETIAILGAAMCLLALVFAPFRPLRTASLAPAAPA
jgi:predicted MFS family arabinose efflux permease